MSKTSYAAKSPIVQRTVQSTVVAAVLCVSGAASAESQPQPVQPAPAAVAVKSERPILLAEPALSIPIGDLSDGVGIGGGASVIYHRPLGPQLAITGRFGVLYHTTDSDVVDSLFVVPILGGVRYYTGPQHTGLYLAAEAGIFWARATAEAFGERISDSDSELGTTLSAGMRLSNIDLRAGLQIYDLGEADDTATLLGTASFRFASL